MAIYGASALRYYAEMLPTLSLSFTSSLSPFFSIYLSKELWRQPFYFSRSVTFFSRFYPLIKIKITTVFVDTRLSKRKHPRKRFENFRQSCVLSRSEGHTSGCDWWISIRSVDNMHDWRKFWKRFHGCFVFESRVSTKTVVKKKKKTKFEWDDGQSSFLLLVT